MIRVHKHNLTTVRKSAKVSKEPYGIPPPPKKNKKQTTKKSIAIVYHMHAILPADKWTPDKLVIGDKSIVITVSPQERMLRRLMQGLTEV